MRPSQSELREGKGCSKKNALKIPVQNTRLMIKYILLSLSLAHGY